MKKVLVTGAGGFIGSHLAEALVRSGCEVRAFVHYNSVGSLGWLDQTAADLGKEMEIISGDIRDEYRVRQAVKGCDTAFHLAALIGIPYSYDAPESYVETNIRGTLNVLQAARDLSVSCVVHTSTSEVYGTAQYVPIDEAHPLHGQSPYAASKIGADQMALSFQSSFGTPVVIVRPFNTYGPRQSARAIVPSIITQVARRTDHIQLGALHPTRDFTYVEDTVRGFIAAANCSKGVGQVVNIGSSFEVSIGELAKMIGAVMGSEVEIRTDEQRVRPAGSEVERLCADNSKALSLFDWAPAVAGREGLRHGLSQTVRWFLSEDNLRRYKAEIYNV